MARAGWVYWVILVVLITAGVLIRVRIAEDLPYDADEAVAGLMARNIAFEGERPIFLYGEDYVGAAAQYLVGTLNVLFGFSPDHLRLPEFVWTAALLCLGALIAIRVGGLESGFWAALLLALPPFFLTFLTLKCWGNYNETFVLGGLIWWATLGFVRDEESPLIATGLGFIWGLAFGLGLWIHFPIVIFALPCAVWLVWSARDLVGWLGGLAILLGTVIGWLPALVYNLQTGFANLGYAAKGSWDYRTRIEQSGELFERFVERGLPFLFGVRTDEARFVEFRQFDPLFQQVAILVGVAVLVGIFLIRTEQFAYRSNGISREKALRESARWIPLGMVALLVAAVLYGRWGGGSFTPRYYSFLYLPLFVMLADSLAWSRPRFAGLTLLWAALFLYGNLYGHVAFLNAPPERRTAQLVQFLESEGIESVFTDYWVAHPVTFLTNEKIIGSVHGGPVRHERYPRYSEEAEKRDHVAYAMYRDHPEQVADRARNELNRLDITFEETEIADLVVFHSLSRKILPSEMDLYYRY